MYCSKCGRRLDSSAVKCPECGAEANPAYCGGFWGLTNTAHESTGKLESGSLTVAEPAYHRESNQAAEDSDRYKQAAEKWEKKYSGTSKIYRIVALVLLVLLLSQVIYACTNKKKIEKLEKETVSIEKYDELKKEYRQLTREKNQLQKKIDELTETDVDNDSETEASTDAETDSDNNNVQDQNDGSGNAVPQSGDDNSPAQGAPRNQSTEVSEYVDIE